MSEINHTNNNYQDPEKVILALCGPEAVKSWTRTQAICILFTILTSAWFVDYLPKKCREHWLFKTAVVIARWVAFAVSTVSCHRGFKCPSDKWDWGLKMYLVCGPLFAGFAGIHGTVDLCRDLWGAWKAKKQRKRMAAVGIALGSIAPPAATATATARGEREGSRQSYVTDSGV